MDSYISIPRFPFSARGDFDQKDMRGGNPAVGWQEVRWSMTQLFAHAASGKAMSVSVYQDGYRKTENIEATGILGLDFEGGGLSAEDLEADEWLKPYAGVIMPTASDTPENPRARVFIPLSRSVSAEQYKALYAVFAARYPGKLDKSTSDNARMFFGAHIEHTAQDDGYTDYTRGYVNDYALLDVDSFLSEYGDSQNATVSQNKAHSSDFTPPQVERAIERQFETLLANMGFFEPHSFAHIADQRVQRAADKLQFVTRLYTPAGHPDYELWYHLWMAAHSATGGSEEMLELICTHEAFQPFWDCDTHKDGRKQLRKAWASRPLPGPDDDQLISGATLNYYAGKCGWGSYSQFDLKRVDRVVKGCHLLDVLQPDELPRGGNVLIKQQTGGGKTTFCMKASEQYEPRKVLWVAPYISLNLDIAHKATVPMNHYRAKDKPKGRALTATLQYITEQRIDPAHYDLLIIEEIHQVLTHLVISPSHMSDTQKGQAIMWLRDALRSPATVIMVDAGINQNTVDFVERLSGQPAYIVVNEHIERKPPIQLIDTDTALDKLYAEPGKRVVAADTKGASRRYHDLLGGDRTNGILINGDTTDQKSQRAFTSDVEAGAARYRDVVYNTAMGSGVSISDTRPDLFILAADYLPATTLNQLLNRYRKQPGIVYAVFDVNARPRIDRRTARASVDSKHQAEYESLQRFIGKVAGEKSDIAQIIDDLHISLLIERNEQLVAPFTYFRRVMAEDGRFVMGAEIDAISERMRQARKQSNAEVTAQYPHWRQGAILDNQSETEIEDMSREEFIRAALHTEIRDVFKRDPAPSDRWADEQFYHAAHRYAPGIGHIERATSPQVDFSGSAVTAFAADTAKYQTKLWAATYLLLKTCSFLLPDLRGRITYETLQQRGCRFVELIRQLEYVVYEVIT